ncbi:helix-turn-helix domain protein [Paenibacillus lactis 154]|uniref:Helix-turn-helix domain protein n=2 Tax=Paenibacillus lactis TaxID=228574 RepID=G4HEG1_9BACL|nr:helix-turn-helix domain protein [Paenibacillus lactis 154]
MPNRIRELRKEQGLSGPKLAEMLSITPTYLYELEKEKKRLSADMASKIAGIFTVSVDYLLGVVDKNKEATLQIEPPDWATSKDKRDFKKMLEEDEPIMFDGVPMTDDDKERLKRVMEAMFWDAKERNKKTFGRKKNT